MDSFSLEPSTFDGFIKLYSCGIVLSTVLSLREIHRFINQTHLRESKPVILNRFQLPKVSNHTWWLFVALWMATLLLSIISWFSIIGLLSSLILYFFVFSRIWSLHFVLKKSSLIPCYLALFIIYRSFEGLLSFELESSAWLASKAILAFVYLGAGISKIKVWRRSPGYLNALQGHLGVSALLRNTQTSEVLIQYPRLCRWIFALTILWEITIPLICIFPGVVSLVYGVMGIGFHLGTLIVMRIDYLRFYWPVYLVFLGDLHLVLGTL